MIINLISKWLVNRKLKIDQLDKEKIKEDSKKILNKKMDYGIMVKYLNFNFYNFTHR